MTTASALRGIRKRLSKLRDKIRLNLNPTAHQSKEDPATIAQDDHQINDHNAETADELRPCQIAYMGASNARRLHKRSTYSLRAAQDRPIFTQHEENASMPVLTGLASQTTIAPPGSKARGLEAEKDLLLRSINDVRRSAPLFSDYDLNAHAQRCADTLPPSEPYEPSNSHVVGFQQPTLVSTHTSSAG